MAIFLPAGIVNERSSSTGLPATYSNLTFWKVIVVVCGVMLSGTASNEFCREKQ